MRLAVLAARESWYYADLVRAAGGRHELTAVSYKSLSSPIGASGLSVQASRDTLGSFDGVLVRSMPPGSLEQVVFRMDALAQLEAGGVAVINPAKAIETAVDKYLATARLQAAGLLVPPTIACQTASEALAAFEQLGGDVVVKPLFGGEGRGITRVSDPAVARRVFAALEQVGAVLYLQEFLPHDGVDFRLLVIGDEVYGMKRINHDDWRTNISLGGTPAPLDVNVELAQLARRAAACVGAAVAGVDLLPARDGRLYALEVNAVPGWRALTAVSGVDIAQRVLRHVEAVC